MLLDRSDKKAMVGNVKSKIKVPWCIIYKWIGAIKLGLNSFSVSLDHTTLLKPVEDTQAQLKHYVPTEVFLLLVIYVKLYIFNIRENYLLSYTIYSTHDNIHVPHCICGISSTIIGRHSSKMSNCHLMNFTQMSEKELSTVCL